MTDRAACACVRLTVLTVLAVLALLFACRPAWSPDGKMLLFPASIGSGRTAIALYERDTGKSAIVFSPADKDGRTTPLWMPDGKGAVFVSTSSLKPKAITVTVMDMPPTIAPQTFEILGSAEHPVDAGFVSSVIVGRRVFLAADSLVRLDLDTGEVKHLADATPDRHFTVMSRGTGVAYLSCQGRDVGAWELGTLDPDTLKLTPLMKDQDLPGWGIVHVPAFSPDLLRIALPASRGEQEEQAILVFANGKLEATLPLGTHQTVGIHDLAWDAHGATIYASLSRRDGDQSDDAWSLFETTISGSVTREAPLFATRRLEGIYPPARQLGLALSPDGKTMALSTAHCGVLTNAKDAGLYLVDLAHKDRKITRVPFPQLEELQIKGSDTMLALGDAWATAFMLEHSGNRGLPVAVTGGGSSVGIKALIEGRADLAMLSRSARPAELAEAKQRDVAVVEHRIAFDALAICVHKDNPIASMTVEQLAAVFGKDGVTRWSELSVTMPAEHDAIAVAGSQSNSGTYEYFREAVLGKRAANLQATMMPTSPDIAQFVQRMPGGIGCLAARFAGDSVKVVPVTAKAGAAALLPTLTTITDGTYPLARPLFLCARAEPKPRVAKFLTWLAGDAGRKATEQAGYFAAR